MILSMKYDGWAKRLLYIQLRYWLAFLFLWGILTYAYIHETWYFSHLTSSLHDIAQFIDSKDLKVDPIGCSWESEIISKQCSSKMVMFLFLFDCLHGS